MIRCVSQKHRLCPWESWLSMRLCLGARPPRLQKLDELHIDWESECLMPISVPYTEPVPVSSTELLVLFFFLPCLRLPPQSLPVSSLHVLCQPRDLFLDFMPFLCYPVVPVCSPSSVLPKTPALLTLPLLSPSAPSLIIIGLPQSENSSVQPWMVDPVAP